MSRTHLGLAFCLGFVTLEAFQAVYLGAVFQGADSFQIGAWIFGLSVVLSVGATALFRPAEIIVALRAWPLVAALNLLAAFAWIAYFLALELIEPAVVFTLFSGMVPLGVVVARWIGVPEACGNVAFRRPAVRVGHGLVLLSLLLLAGFTVAGLSGFVRGGPSVAIAGVAFAAVSGGLTAFVFVYSVRLNARGVGPLAQFGLRFMLYPVLAALAYRAGIYAKGAALAPDEPAAIVAVGLLVVAFPLYLVQKAVPLIPAPTIAAMTALGPAMVFAMQLVEGRV